MHFCTNLVRTLGRVVELRSYAERVRVYFEDECVADHRRRFGRDQTVFDPWHYLPVLPRKPGALRNGAPFKDWALPVAIKRTLERLKSYNDWDRQSVDILAMVPLYGLESVAQACDQALLSGSVSRDRVLNLLSRANEEGVTEELETPAHLELREPPLADCARYDRFRRQEGSTKIRGVKLDASRGTPEFLVMEPMNPVPGPSCHRRLTPRILVLPLWTEPRVGPPVRPVCHQRWVSALFSSSTPVQKRRAALSFSWLSASPASLAWRVASTLTTVSGLNCHRMPVRTVRSPASPSVIPT